MQLQSRCAAHGIWPQVDPESTTPLIPKLKALEMPLIAKFSPATHVKTPTQINKLLTSSLKAFKEALKYYKIKANKYKSDRHNFKREQTSL